MNRMISLLLVFSLLGASTSVVLYPNIAYVQREYMVPQGYFVLPLEDVWYPSFDRLSVYGSSLDRFKIVRSEYNISENMKDFSELLNDSLGKEINFLYEDKSVMGKLMWYDKERIGVETGNGMYVYPLRDVGELQLPVSDFMKSVSRDVFTVRGFSKAPSELSVRYATSMISWDVYYDINLDDSTLVQYAHIKNSGRESYPDAKLMFVIAEPNLVSSFRPMYLAAKSMAADFESNEAMPVPEATYDSVGYWMYIMNETIDIPSNSEFGLMLFNSKADFEERVEWNDYWGSVWKVVKFDNPSDDTLPSGKVRVFKDGMFLGEDLIESSPKGKDLQVRVTKLSEVEVIPESSNKREGDWLKVVQKYTVKNYGPDQEVYVRIHLPQYLTDFSIEGLSPEPVDKGDDWVLWRVNVKSGSEKTLEFKYRYRAPRSAYYS